MPILKLAYFGSPIFSATLLEKLILDKSLGIEIALVVTQPDKPVGRKMIMTPSPVKVVAQKYNIPVFDNLKFEIRNSKSSSNDKFSKNLNIENSDLNSNFKLKIKNLDLCLVYAYGFKQLIPLDLLRAPKMQFEIGEGKTSGFINIHPSLLPLYRGSSPIAYPILLGENKTGVTLFVMDEKMDHGPIIAQEELEITLTDVRADMEIKLTDLGLKMVKNFLNSLIRESVYPERSRRVNSLILKPQLHEQATRSPFMTKDDGFIPLSVLKKALNNEPLTLEELPQIIRKYIEKYSNLQYPMTKQSPISNDQTSPKSQLPKQGAFHHLEIVYPESSRRGNCNFLENWKLKIGNSPKIIYDFWRGMSPWPGLWTLIEVEPPRLRSPDEVGMNSAGNPRGLNDGTAAMIQPPRFDSVQKDRIENTQPPRFDSVQKDRIENTQPPRFDAVQKDRTSEVNMAGKRLKILNLQLYNFKTLKLVTVQLEGKSPVDFPTFQKAYPVFE